MFSFDYNDIHFCFSMATPEFLKPGSRPASPAPVSWFEYLLNPELLVRNLDKPQPIPGPDQLIIQFLQQANALELSHGDSKKADGKGTKDLPGEPAKDDENSTGRLITKSPYESGLLFLLVSYNSASL